MNNDGWSRLTTKQADHLAFAIGYLGAAKGDEPVPVRERQIARDLVEAFALPNLRALVPDEASS